MATWSDVEAAIKPAGPQRLGDTAWLVELPIHNTTRTQKVFLFYELMPPDYEIIKIRSPVTLLTDVDEAASSLPISVIAAADAGPLFQIVGGLRIASAGYTPRPEDEVEGRISGTVSLETTIPLSLLDLTDPFALLLYLSLLAGAADKVESSLATQYGKVDSQDYF